MSTFTKLPLSVSSYGKGVSVAATATTGTTIHTAASGTSSLDEVWLYAVNTSSSAVVLTVEWGETAAEGDIIVSVPGQSGLMLIVPGLLLQNGCVVTAFAGTTAVIVLHGYVNRIT